MVVFFNDIKNCFMQKLFFFVTFYRSLVIFPINSSGEGNSAERKENQSSKFGLLCLWPIFWTPLYSGWLCSLFPCDAPPERPPQSPEADILPDFDQKGSCLCPEDTACSSLLETLLKSPRSLLSSELSPEKLGGHFSHIFSALPPPWAALSAVTAAAPSEIILALDHFSSWQLHCSLINWHSIFGLHGSNHPGGSDARGCWLQSRNGLYCKILLLSVNPDLVI